MLITIFYVSNKNIQRRYIFFFLPVSAQLGCSDLIQPGLMGLQPNLDDLMDIDVVQGMCLVCFA